MRKLTGDPGLCDTCDDRVISFIDLVELLIAGKIIDGSDWCDVWRVNEIVYGNEEECNWCGNANT